MKAFYELVPKNAYYHIEYEMSVTGALLNQLLEKHGLSQDMIQTKESTIDWLLEGFPETPVDVVRIISGILYRETGFVQDLKGHWLEV